MTDFFDMKFKKISENEMAILNEDGTETIITRDEFVDMVVKNMRPKKPSEIRKGKQCRKS